MARLLSIPPFLGTYKGIVVYTRWGNYYIRTKSTLSGKRVKSAPEFRRTMQSASILAKASRIASLVYRERGEKRFSLYRKLTGQAMLALKEGQQAEAVLSAMELQWCGTVNTLRIEEAIEKPPRPRRIKMKRGRMSTIVALQLLTTNRLVEQHPNETYRQLAYGPKGEEMSNLQKSKCKNLGLIVPCRSVSDLQTPDFAVRPLKDPTAPP